MKADNITFAVCGTGRIGRRHAKIIHEYGGAGLAGCIDIDQEKEQTLDKLGIDAPFYIGLEDFIREDNGKTDVINICTPNGLHAPLAIRALRSGYHTVIEKPMAITVSDCNDVINASREFDREVFIVKQNRYSPPVRWLKSVVEDGKLGDIYLVQIGCFWNRDERYYKNGGWHGTLELDGGTLLTQFSHFVDIMYWVFGEVEKVEAKLENLSHETMIEFEDSGIAQFEFKNGGMGSFNYSTSCWGQNMESSITVIGSKGTLKIGGQYMDTIEYCHIEDYEMPELEPTNPPNDYGPFKGSAANHHYVIENVVETLRGNSEATTNAIEGMKVVEIIEQIYEFR